MSNFSWTAVLAAVVSVSSAVASEYVPGEVIVKYKSGVIRTRTEANALYNAAGIQSVKRYAGETRGLEQLKFDAENIRMEDVMQTLLKDDTVEYVQPNFILRALPIADENDVVAQDGPPAFPCLFPGFPPGCEDNAAPPTERPAVNPAPKDVVPPVADPSLAQAYGISKISAPDAWKTNRGSKAVVVAVIDTGVDYNHEDLSYNIWRNTKSTADLVGHDFVHNDGLPFDDNKHGTHCAGTIGAVGGNGKGVSGVNQRVSIMAIKFLSGQGSGTTADAIRGIDFAVANGAKVLSNSWGGHGDDGNQALRESIDRARAKDVLFIAAAGNESVDNDGSDPAYPAGFNMDNMIAVAATDRNDVIASFSNWGKKSVHFAAPGVGVYSTTPGNKYEMLSGTSMACPHVAGAAALVWSKNQKMTYKQVKQILMQSTDKVPALASKTVTGGRLNVMAALKAVK